jgi:hypothetical protein
MGVDHEQNLQTVFSSHADIEIRIVDGVAHGALSLAASAKDVRSGNNRMLVEQLA